MGQSRKQSKYQVVEDHLRDQISSGAFPIGSMLPTEEMLCEQFGVSRATVRTALANLQSDGQITRSAAIGSRVVSASPDRQFQSGWSSFDDLMQYTANIELSILGSENVNVDKHLEKDTGFAAGRRLAHVEGVRKEQGSSEISCLLQIYFDVLYSGILELFGQTSKPIAALIEEHYRIKIKSIRQEISAGSLTEREANILCVSTGSAALIIKRSYFDTENRMFEMARTVYPADRFRYVMDLDRSSGEKSV